MTHNDMPPMSDACKLTQLWFEEIVLKDNFCPFAHQPHQNDAVRFTELAQTKRSHILQAVVDECLYLSDNPQVSTSVLVLSSMAKSFYDYLDLIADIEHLLELEGYEGIYQVASFHPDYVFDGLDEADASNYTNRAPFPLLHLIREQELEDAVKGISNPESIPDRNIDYAREKGAEYFEQKLGEIRSKFNNV